jgi:hypothetical protein
MDVGVGGAAANCPAIVRNVRVMNQLQNQPVPAYFARNRACQRIDVPPPALGARQTSAR